MGWPGTRRPPVSIWESNRHIVKEISLPCTGATQVGGRAPPRSSACGPGVHQAVPPSPRRASPRVPSPAPDPPGPRFFVIATRGRRCGGRVGGPGRGGDRSPGCLRRASPRPPPAPERPGSRVPLHRRDSTGPGPGVGAGWSAAPDEHRRALLSLRSCWAAGETLVMMILPPSPTFRFTAATLRDSEPGRGCGGGWGGPGRGGDRSPGCRRPSPRPPPAARRSAESRRRTGSARRPSP